MKQMFASLSLVLVVACGGPIEVDDGVDAIPAVENVAGKHVHTLTVDGMAREVIVHVPAAAAGPTPVPAVFMLHGTSGDGERFYGISGWREQADAEGFIAVFPSALTYCLFEDENADGDFDDAGERKVTTKWAAGELGAAEMPLCGPDDLAQLTAENRARADHPLMDDVAFMDAIRELLAREYAVDARRIHASGFSNGAGMTSRLALERSREFAAIAAAAGGLAPEPVPAARALSLVLSVGALDDRFTTAFGVPAIPIGPDAFTQVPRMAGWVAPYLTMLQLERDFTYAEQLVGGERVGTYTFATSTVGATNTLTFVIIEGLHHQYPNGSNHPLTMANALWTFFAAQTLP